MANADLIRKILTTVDQYAVAESQWDAGGVDADAHIDTMWEMVHSPNLERFAQQTDRQHGTDLGRALADLRRAADQFLDEYKRAP